MYCADLCPGTCIGWLYILVGSSLKTPEISTALQMEGVNYRDLFIKVMAQKNTSFLPFSFFLLFLLSFHLSLFPLNMFPGHGDPVLLLWLKSSAKLILTSVTARLGHCCMMLDPWRPDSHKQWTPTALNFEVEKIKRLEHSGKQLFRKQYPWSVFPNFKALPEASLQE